MEETYMKQIKEHLPNHSHVEKDLPFQEWLEAGRPYCWIKRIDSDEAVAFMDVGYGCVALFEKGRLTALNGQSVTVGEHYIVLSEDRLRLFKEVSCEDVDDNS